MSSRKNILILVLAAVTILAVALFLYNTDYMTQDTDNTNALQKICAGSSEDIIITTRMNEAGKVGGYSAFTGVLDGTSWLYDAEGNGVWQGPIRSLDYDKLHEGFGPLYPIEQELSCIKKQLITPSSNRDYTVFSGVPGRDVVIAGDTGWFMPRDEDVALAEKLIKANMPTLDSYYRQYYGVRDKDGHRQLHMTAIIKTIEAEHPDWRTKPVLVDDGGEDYIDAAVDLDTTTLIYAQYHGEA